MSDLKMSEVFGLPVIEGNFVNEHTRMVCDQKGVFAMSNISASSRVAHAINNHDRLVEEIAQLKADVAELVESLNTMTDFAEHQMNPWQNDPSLFDDEDSGNLSHAKNLLQKHKG